MATKKGSGGRFHIAYDGHIGFDHIYKTISMLNADEFRSAASRLGMNIIDQGHNTDFIKSITRSGLVHNQHIAFGGGSATANYRASIGVTDHKTVIRKNSFRNYVAKLDVQQQAFDNRLTVDLGVLGSMQKNEYIPLQQKLFYSAATFNPTFASGRNAQGGYDGVTEALWINNPNALLDIKDDDNNAHFNVHLLGKVNLGLGFTLSAFGSFTYNNVQSGHYYPTSVWSHGEAYRRSAKTEDRLGNLSLAFRAQYSFKNRYSLNVTARADGSSKVGRNHRWGFFPSVSGAWVVSDEPWMQSLAWIDKLKLRVGYGRSGNLGGIDSYQSQQLVQPDFDLVRNRVGAEPRTISLQALFDERLLELCWEGWRRQDLIRFGQYRSLYQGPDAVDESDGHTCLFPIPADALDLNKNLTQNPGY